MNSNNYKYPVIGSNNIQFTKILTKYSNEFNSDPNTFDVTSTTKYN